MDLMLYVFVMCAIMACIAGTTGLLMDKGFK
jgi:hypothetical protein